MRDGDAPALVRHRPYLAELVRFWGFLADLGFSDLLVVLPVLDPGQVARRAEVVAQVRPATAQTVHPGDLVGMQLDLTERGPVASVLATGQMTTVTSADPRTGRRVQTWYIPLAEDGEVFGVLVRDQLGERQRNPGELESTYMRLFDRFMQMLVAGRFPYPPSEVEEAPRVGDGVCVLGEDERIQFLSPNALSALHRLGLASARAGESLEGLGLRIQAPSRARSLGAPVFEEVEGPRGATVTFYALPLLDLDRVDGYVLLLRDVTDLRQRDRLLASKDATIREVHHRVKNNLQTISSLLNLQARRVTEVEARNALREAERRIRSIAVVHEYLSRDVAEEVPIDEVILALVRMAEESKLPGRELEVSVEGSAGVMDSQRVTPLAIALAELMQNALEHGYGAERTSLRLRVILERLGSELMVEVADDGVGFPEDLERVSERSLGLAIVRDLVQSQLEGQISFGRARLGGAQVRLRIPLVPPERGRLASRRTSR
jgi:two-component sensor histidine kinase